MTQERLGEKLGIGHTAVSAIETGRNSLPPEHYEELCALLGIDEKEFGKFMLRYTNPWLYALVTDFKDKQLMDDLSQLPSRCGRLEG